MPRQLWRERQPQRPAFQLGAFRCLDTVGAATALKPAGGRPTSTPHMCRTQGCQRRRCARLVLHNAPASVTGHGHFLRCLQRGPDNPQARVPPLRHPSMAVQPPGTVAYGECCAAARCQQTAAPANYVPGAEKTRTHRSSSQLARVSLGAQCSSTPSRALLAKT